MSCNCWHNWRIVDLRSLAAVMAYNIPVDSARNECILSRAPGTIPSPCAINVASGAQIRYAKVAA